MSNPISRIKSWSRSDKIAAVVIPIVISVIAWSFCELIEREHEAQALCTEVDGRDYKGCVYQQYHILRAERHTE